MHFIDIVCRFPKVVFKVLTTGTTSRRVWNTKYEHLDFSLKQRAAIFNVANELHLTLAKGNSFWKKYFHSVQLTFNNTVQKLSFAFRPTQSKDIQSTQSRFSTGSTGQTLTHLVFVRVAELRVHHVNDAASVRPHVEAELLLPGPGVGAGDSSLVELLDHADVVDDVQDQGLQLQLQDARLCQVGVGGRDGREP